MFSSPSKASKRLELTGSNLGSPVLTDVFISPKGKKRGADDIARTPPRPLTSTLSGLEDRFIPNRAKADEDLSYYLVTNAENPPAIASPTKSTPSHQKFRQELSLLSPTEGKRIMDCRKSLTPQFERASSSSGIFPVSLYHNYSVSISIH